MKHLLFYLACLLLLMLTWQSSGQVNEGEQDAVNRQPVFAGKFYPKAEGEFKNTLKDFFAQAKKKEPEAGVAALIAPHAGYPYSGQVAASAYNQLDPEHRFDNIFIIVPSHRASFGGVSVYHKGGYITHLENVDVNRELAYSLIEKHDVFVFNKSAHSKEHSLEVQLPFLQYHLKRDFQIVPIVTGSQDQTTMKAMAGALEPYFNENNLFVVSTDFSHYPEYNQAVAVDKATAGAIVKNSPDELVRVFRSNAEKDVSDLATSMFGWLVCMLC